MRLLALIAAMLCAPCAAWAQSPSDFARGADIRADGVGTIVRVLLPDEVYDTTTRVDLGDVRVFNARGDVVPHTIREAPRPASTQGDWRAVPSFPLTETQPGSAMKTRVRIGAGGTVLEVVNAAAPDQAVTAHLVDASALTEPVGRVRLEWDAPPQTTFLSGISILGSDDLDAWRPIVGSAAIAQMRRDEYTLQQNEIELPASVGRVKYLRVSWPTELAGVALKAVRVRPQPTSPEREVRWRTLTAERVEAGTATYESRAWLPTEYVDLEFVDSTDAALVTVRSRTTASADWVSRHSGLFYSLDDPQGAVHSQRARIVRTTDRYWSAETSRVGGWRSDRAPRLRLGWHPHELVFLAQGPAPYRLAYGSARVGPTDAPVDTLLVRLREEDLTKQVRLATVGPSQNLGGPDVLAPPPPWRRIVLWAVLVVAVGALALLAARLFRDTQTAGGGRS
jgi:hypothetical protein